MMCCMMMHAMNHTAHTSPTTATSGPQEESLHDILRRRYALGEISREQFEEMKQVLGVTPESVGASGTGHAHPMSGGGTP
jgi:uncharacterized membrane protein